MTEWQVYFFNEEGGCELAYHASGKLPAAKAPEAAESEAQRRGISYREVRLALKEFKR